MARIAGVDLAPNKRVEIALRAIYGIGSNNARKVIESAGVAEGTLAKNLTEAQVSSINSVITRDWKVEGELRRELESDIRRYIEIGSYRGQRHRRNLPARGQRTRTNARTRRGLRRTVGSAKPGIKPKSAQAAEGSKT